MTLEEFCRCLTDDVTVCVYDYYGYANHAVYDGHDSIPEELNPIEIHIIQASGRRGFAVFLNEYYETLCELLEGVE